MDILAMAVKLFTKNGMVASFMVLGLITFIAYKMGGLTKGRVHGSAIAIFLGLVLAYFGGSVTGGSKGIADNRFLREWGWSAVPCSVILLLCLPLSARISAKLRRSV